MIVELRHLPAPAKLNLFLHVTGRRADGYHLLEMVFELIDLADTMHFRLREDGQVCQAAPLSGVPPESDLSLRAAKLLAEHAGCRLGVEITLEKRIPMGGGLGGGSSDAATTLMALNRLWGLHWPRRRLLDLAVQLGADVPFFIFGRTAYATGIGDELRTLKLPQRHYVVVAPSVSVPTQSVFADPDLTRDTKPLRITGLSRGGNVFRGRNDLQDVVVRRQPKVAQALSALRQAAEESGQDSRLARMTGSGACVFLPTTGETQAQAVVRRLSGSTDAKVFATRSLTVHPLRDWAFDKATRK